MSPKFALLLFVVRAVAACEDFGQCEPAANAARHMAVPLKELFKERPNAKERVTATGATFRKALFTASDSADVQVTVRREVVRQGPNFRVHRRLVRDSLALLSLAKTQGREDMLRYFACFCEAVDSKAVAVFVVTESLGGSMANDCVSEQSRVFQAFLQRSRSQRLQVYRQLSRQLEFIHSSGFALYNFDPAEVRFVGDRPESAKFTDFSYAQRLGSRVIAFNEDFADPQTSAKDKVNEQADIWGFGMLVAEAEVGRQAKETTAGERQEGRDWRLQWRDNMLAALPTFGWPERAGRFTLTDMVQEATFEARSERTLRAATLTANLDLLVTHYSLIERKLAI